MDLFSCGQPRKPARPEISRPLEASHLQEAYHVHATRTGEGLRLWREAEARRKAEEKREERKARQRQEAKQGQNRHGPANHSRHLAKVQWADTIDTSDRESEHPSVQEIEDNRRYVPRRKHERHEHTATPIIKDQQQEILNQISSKDKAIRSTPIRTLRVMNPIDDQWCSDGGLTQPRPSKALPRAHDKPLRLEIPVRPPQKIMEVTLQKPGRENSDF